MQTEDANSAPRRLAANYKLLEVFSDDDSKRKLDKQSDRVPRHLAGAGGEGRGAFDRCNGIDRARPTVFRAAPRCHWSARPAT